MANKYFAKTKLTGNSIGALDNIEGKSLSASDIATVVTDNMVYNYSLVAATTIEATPITIQPDVDGTNFRWSLQNICYKVFSNGTIPEPASPLAGSSVLWLSDGTGYGDTGDICTKITVGATTKVVTIIDWSTE